MKRTTIQRTGLLLATIAGTLSLAAVSAGAVANASSNTAAKAAAQSAAQQARVKLIITRGNSEISRRLSSLGGLSSKISSASKLSSADQASLSSEVSTEVSGLTSLKATLDADTTVSAAQTDAQSIINGYRVYALIVPKVNLVKTADDQQAAEAKLTGLAAKLQARITAAQTDGKSVASIQSSLTEMTAKINAARTISSQIESSVINLQPSDYNSNHSVLSGDRDQLKTGQTDLQAAVTSAGTIISELKAL
jgi:hypothetical protein